jgi:lysophospholipase L1-like esterase
MAAELERKQILFLGDSLAEYGDWPTLLPQYSPVNRGRAGETVGELSARLAGEMERAPGCGVIVLMSGTNDLLMGDEHFTAVFDTMLPRLRMLAPQAAVTVVGIAPMPQAGTDAVNRINREMAKAAAGAGCAFLDIIPSFHLQCRPAGNPCFLADGVHYTPHGYRVLADTLRRHLESFL